MDASSHVDERQRGDLTGWGGGGVRSNGDANRGLKGMGVYAVRESPQIAESVELVSVHPVRTGTAIIASGSVMRTHRPLWY